VLMLFKWTFRIADGAELMKYTASRFQQRSVLMCNASDAYCLIEKAYPDTQRRI
jgi:hypothetical protein